MERKINKHSGYHRLFKALLASFMLKAAYFCGFFFFSAPALGADNVIEQVKSLSMPREADVTLLRERYAARFSVMQAYPLQREALQLSAKLFQDIVQMMLEPLNETQKQAVQRAIQDTKFYEDKAPSTLSFRWFHVAPSPDKLIHLSVHPAMRDSTLMHLQWLHLVAHAMQELLLGEQIRRYHLRASSLEKAKLEAYLERHSIAWEWVVHTVVPHDYRQALVQRLQSVESWNSAYDGLYFDLISKTRAEYLRFLWDHHPLSPRAIYFQGRYDKADTALFKLMLAGGAGCGGLGLYYVWGAISQ